MHRNQGDQTSYRAYPRGLMMGLLVCCGFADRHHRLGSLAATAVHADQGHFCTDAVTRISGRTCKTLPAPLNKVWMLNLCL